jgi:L-iditol 2-dehydrogenase
VNLEFHVMRRKEITLFNVRRSNHESEAAIELLREYMPRWAPVITHTRPVDRIEESFAMLESYADGVGKLVISLD